MVMSSVNNRQRLIGIWYVQCILIPTIICAMFVVVVHAEEPLGDSVQIQIQQLVQRLGDDSYRNRERAGEKLLKFGLQTKAALFAGMNSKDLEIAMGCRRLWCEVRIEVGWQQVRQVIGNSLESRDLFDEMFLAAPALWYELAEKPRSFDAVFEERLAKLKGYGKVDDLSAKFGVIEEQRMVEQSGNWKGALANLLYFGFQVKRDSRRQGLQQVDDLLSTGRSLQAFNESESLRKLRDEWTAATDSDVPAFTRLMLALQGQRWQAVEFAREVLRDEASPAEQRQYALLALAKSHKPEDEKLISDSLADSSSLDVLIMEGFMIHSEIRDVALAAIIYRNGRNPKDFGFVYLRPDDSTLYSPPSLGFKDATERDAAFKKWSTFASHQGEEE